MDFENDNEFKIDMAIKFINGCVGLNQPTMSLVKQTLLNILTKGKYYDE